MKDSNSSATVLAVVTALLLSLLPLKVQAQDTNSEPEISMSTVTLWNDSLQSLRAPDLIPRQYASWKKHYEKTLSDYQRDANGSSFLRRAQHCAIEFAEIEPQAFAAHFLVEVDRALNSAKQAGAKRYAPLTLSRAEMYYEKAIGALNANRNNLAKAKLERSRAKYEADHALAIANQIIPQANQEQSSEQTILNFEKQLQHLGEALEIQLRFSDGSDRAIADLIQATVDVKLERQTAQEKLEQVNSAFREVFNEIGISVPQGDDEQAYVSALSAEFGQLVRELDDSKRELRQYRARVSELRIEKETAETILSSKEAKERRFSQTRALFNSDEAIVLYNGSQDIVIRLRGLTFPSGVAQLSQKHDSLLAKITQALALYANAHIVVEGHTDNTGGAKLNIKLSEKRAKAVMEYLIESSGRPAGDFKAIGYGAEKPVANNQTDYGRKENRRIDVILVR